MRLVTRISAGLAALALAGCSGGTDRPSVNLQLIEAGREVVASKTAAKGDAVVMNRALLDSLDRTLLEATLESHDLTAYLFVNLERTDAYPGKIMVWRTDDNITLSTRAGVLIATRGMGGDILSTDLRVSDSVPGPSGNGGKTHYVRNSVNGVTPLVMACEVTDAGPETIEIYEHNHSTSHVQERCEGGGGTVINDYWIDSRSNLVWQSRQWAGPHIGYLRLRRLTK